jgi:ParB family chromosome partitioning protein
MTTNDESSEAPAPTTPLTKLVQVDPASLVDHPDNVRKGKPDVADMVDSVREVGVLEPVLVVPGEDDTLVVVAGHRRKYAAIAAERTPIDAIIRFDLATQSGAISTMLVENLQRQDLSDAETAAGFQALLDLGEEAGRIGKLAGVDAETVERAASSTRAKKAHGIALKHDLDLEQALILSEFEDDKEALKELAVVAVKEPNMLEHRASRIRHERRATAATEESKAKAKEAGLKLLKQGPRYDAKVTEPMKVSDLVHKDGTPVEVGEADCAYINHDGELVPMVENPKERTFKKKPSPNAAPRKERTEEDREKMRQTIANNKAWPAATEVRQAFLAKAVQARTPKKGMLGFVLRTLINDGRIGDDIDRKLVDDWFGVPKKATHYGATAIDDLLDSADPRLTVVAFAHVAAGIEGRIGVKDGWRRHQGHHAAYLGFLASIGYQLSEIEQSLVPTAAKPKPNGGTKAA